MPRKITTRNPKHPRNIALNEGRRVKESLRKLSNVELTEFLKRNIENEKDLSEVLSWSRTKQIRFCKDSAIQQYINWYKEESAKRKEKEKELEDGKV